nr:hypothetical protein EVB34_006 [Rhizobium phage RHph_TM26]
MTFDAQKINDDLTTKMGDVAGSVADEIITFIRRTAERADVIEMAALGETSHAEMALRIVIIGMAGAVNGYPRLESPEHKAYLMRLFLIGLGYEEIEL